MLFSEDCRRLWDFALGNSTSRAQWDSEQGLKISYILTSIIEFKIFWKSFPQGQCIEAMVREGPRLHLSWKLDPVMCKPPMWYWFWRHEKVVRSNWGLALREARRSPGEGAALVAQEIPGYQRFLWPWTTTKVISWCAMELELVWAYQTNCAMDGSPGGVELPIPFRLRIFQIPNTGQPPDLSCNCLSVIVFISWIFPQWVKLYACVCVSVSVFMLVCACRCVHTCAHTCIHTCDMYTM